MAVQVSVGKSADDMLSSCGNLRAGAGAADAGAADAGAADAGAVMSTGAATTCSRTGELSFVSPLPPSFVFTEPGADRADQGANSSGNSSIDIIIIDDSDEHSDDGDNNISTPSPQR